VSGLRKLYGGKGQQAGLQSGNLRLCGSNPEEPGAGLINLKTEKIYLKYNISNKYKMDTQKGERTLSFSYAYENFTKMHFYYEKITILQYLIPLNIFENANKSKKEEKISCKF
jgi:hypothetical protein